MKPSIPRAKRIVGQRDTLEAPVAAVPRRRDKRTTFIAAFDPLGHAPTLADLAALTPATPPAEAAARPLAAGTARVPPTPARTPTRDPRADGPTQPSDIEVLRHGDEIRVLFGATTLRCSPAIAAWLAHALLAACRAPK
jgi:hypothetical protein